MATGTVNVSDASLAPSRIFVKALIPIGAATRRLDEALMSYLDAHGVTPVDLLVAAFELATTSTHPLDKDAVLSYCAYDRYINTVEQLEYNNQPFDPETLEASFTQALYVVYTATFTHYRAILDEAAVPTLSLPYVNSHALKIHGSPADENGYIYLEVTIDDDVSYEHYR